jgi:hypothetical protein
VIELASIYTLSWASGTLEGVEPQEVVNHIQVLDQLKFDDILRYISSDGRKVIFVFHPTSPASQETADKSQLQAQAPLISWKSAFETTTVQALIVLEVQGTLLFTIILFVEEFPFIVSVQLTV